MNRNLANVDLNLLVSLDALLMERNVTRAAERMMVGQSAMSSTLSRLRRLFDDPLLVKQGRGMALTPLAESLAAPVREALGIVESVLTVHSHFDPGTDHRTFTISASDYVTLVLLRPLLESIAQEAPNIRVNIIPIKIDEYTEDLRREQTDLLLLPRELLPRELGYPHASVLSDGYVVAVDEQHPDIGEEISLEQFSELPYVAYRSGSRPSLVDMQLDALNIARNVEVTAQSFVIAPMLLKGTRLIMLAHAQLGHLLAAQHGLRLLRPPMPLRPADQIMLWTSRHTADAGHQWLRERVLEVARQCSPPTLTPPPE